MLNYEMATELRRRFATQFAEEEPIWLKFYKAVEERWPQFNGRTNLFIIDRPYQVIHRPLKFSPQAISPAYERMPGIKAWFWRLWYEIMVRVGDNDTVLHRRGWYPLYQPIPSIYDDIEFVYFQFKRSDFFGAQVTAFTIQAGYDAATDTLFLVKGETEHEIYRRVTESFSMGRKGW